MASTTPDKVTLKLLYDNKTRKVVYAESGKDFVDFLFTLVSLPIATLANLASKNGNDILESVSKISDSVKNLDVNYKQPDFDKDILLKSNKPVTGANNILCLSFNEVKLLPLPRNLYACSSSSSSRCGYVTSTKNSTKCPECNYYLNSSRTFVSPPAPTSIISSRAGYVKDNYTYTIMDDLEVKPLTSIISFVSFLLEKSKSSDLQTKVVDVGMEEGIEIMKAVLGHSKTVLTDVFLVKKDS